MKLGTEAHKVLFCQSFIDSHRQYEPEQLPWPQLDDVALERLRGIPFWEAALETERQAGVMVKAFAETVDDPLIREAIALQGYEENRHARLIEYMIRHYEIQITEPPPVALPSNLKSEFLGFGYGECLDSFLAFGLFDIARQSGFFPEALFTIFSSLLDEEARHITFLVNWVAYSEVQQGRGNRVLRGVNSLWQYSRALRHLLGIVSNPDNGGEGFTATGAKTFMDDLTLEIFLSSSIQANQRRMASVDERLLQPKLLPTLASIALSFVRLMPNRQADKPALPEEGLKTP
ncbi:MAG TPA: ferritin-like domain-containing protein [Coleofasciculaceae cyanobacterium]